VVGFIANSGQRQVSFASLATSRSEEGEIGRIDATSSGRTSCEQGEWENAWEVEKAGGKEFFY
jgi:hypothetical protein